MLPAVTISGKFSTANSDGLVQHSGFICIDIDDIAEELSEAFARLKDDPYIHFLARSASGAGLFGFVRIPDDPAKHKDIAQNLIQYYASTYNVVLDRKCTDIPRKRFVSYDPEAVLNPDSKVFRKAS
ncbi:BT4734/BF3469 family protein, partial [Arthrospira platensis SPKY1]|nr:BT4734/BF3469 family protein [Arthrospira platensis SPKY1]